MTARAYVIANVEVLDGERYKDYVRQTPATVAAFGGRFIARGGQAERLEGVIAPMRIVVIEFESYERARAWWDSEMYAAPKALRQTIANSNILLVEGVAADGR